MATEARRARRRRQRARKRERKAENEIVVIECDYCGKPSELKTGADVYPHRPDLSGKVFWCCDPCEARVGCHPDTVKPLGRLANEQLRALKIAAHAKFDLIWKTNQMRRKDAYAWLSNELDIPVKYTHIGMFDEDMCERTIEACNERNRERITA